MSKDKKIKIAFFDVDGVLTDGTKFYYQDGTVSKKFYDHDSYGLKMLQAHEVIVFLISEDKRVNKKWAEWQHIPFVCSNKKANTVKTILQEQNLSVNEASYVGDDIRDLEAMKLVKYSMAPSNTVDMIKQYAFIRLKKSGGEGAVREAVEIILKINQGG